MTKLRSRDFAAIAQVTLFWLTVGNAAAQTCGDGLYPNQRMMEAREWQQQAITNEQNGNLAAACRAYKKYLDIYSGLKKYFDVCGPAFLAVQTESVMQTVLMSAEKACKSDDNEN